MLKHNYKATAQYDRYMAWPQQFVMHGMCSLTLCRTMACFERNLHNQISSGDSFQSTTFCGNQVVDTTFLFHDPL